MELLNKYKRIPIANIRVPRSDRQRRIVRGTDGAFVNSDGLLESIAARGVYNPIIVTDELVLIAGERRLEASRELGLHDIPCRYVSELSETEGKIIELEENLKRAELPWRDRVRAIAELNDIYMATEPDWSAERTGEIIGEPNIYVYLRVAKDLESVRITRASSVREAYNTLCRIDERALEDTMSAIEDASRAVFLGAASPRETAAAPGEPGSSPPLPAAVRPAPSLLRADFIQWAEAYAGPRFNFIHCDFPYGGGLFGGDQSGRTRYITYDDQAAAYSTLLAALCAHFDRFATPSAHLMFWLPADIYRQWHTLEYFREHAPFLNFWRSPLVWHKTDNAGILADPNRGPRHVYETAIIASREDRPLASAGIADAYGAPTDKAYHPSTKPEPMLRHFFRMFVDGNTAMLDPTCGGGSALRAAESLGAAQVLGLEIEAEHFNSALSALRSFRALRKAPS